jgi:hypothetical protein
MPLVDMDFDMQPLSRVKPDAMTNWGEPYAMVVRPKLAGKVAHCIALWAEIEIFLGAFLGLLLHTNEKAAVAMYSALENRAAQLRMLIAAAEASLEPSRFEVVTAFLSSIIRPAMRERDRLAHWTWGHSDQLPDALLIAEPGHTLSHLMEALKRQRGVRPTVDVPSDFTKIYVVRQTDLDGIAKRSAAARDLLRVAMATVWNLNTPAQRDVYLQQLSSVPEIRAALDRQREAQKNSPEAPPPFSPQESNG